MSKRFENKVVLVTGGGRGIGKAIASAFAEQGAKVMIAARTLSSGEAVVAELTQRGFQAAVVQASNADRASMKNMVETTVATFGGLDVVVHSAAHWIQQEVIDMADEDFDELITSNIHSMFWLAKDCQPYLSQSSDRGRMIFISSGAANRQFIPGAICYAATKTYMNFFARGLAIELGKHNILVNVVEPGLVASDRAKDNLDDKTLNALTSTYPVARPGEPEEIAASVLFMASKEAAYITGSALLVDGGSSMAPMPDLEAILSGVEQ